VLPQRVIDEFVLLDERALLEGRGDDDRLEMVVVIGLPLWFDGRFGVIELGFDERRHFVRLHTTGERSGPAKTFSAIRGRRPRSWWMIAQS